jgi:large subunit ribosomal protein L23
MVKSPYDIITKPLLTEKTTRGKEQRIYSFAVGPSANKIDIKKAIEQVFSVKVDKVRTMNVKGKVKRHKMRLGVRKNWKKAMVVLQEGYRIEI